MMSSLDNLYVVPTHMHTRWASSENPSANPGAACRNNDGRKRRACFPIAAGESVTLLDLQDVSGTIRRIWITCDDRSPKMLRGLRLDAFWDGADTPAVSAPLGDFFCHGLGQISPFQASLFASPEGRSFCCYVPMPFHSAAKIIVTNETDTPLPMFYYDINVTIGDTHPPEMTWLHAHWRRENPTTLRQDYTLLPSVQGRGRFLGCNCSMCADTHSYFKSWWGEGEVKIYLDGDTEYPTLCGTGTEDYIGTGWGQGRYDEAYHGCLIADKETMRYAFYRLHVPDPIWFHSECRATIQQLGCWEPDNMLQMVGAGMQLYHGNEAIDMAAAAKARQNGLFERQDDWSSCVWFYLDRPTNDLPALPPAELRYTGLA